MEKKFIIIITVALTVILIANLLVGGYFYWSGIKNEKAKKAIESVSNAAKDITGSATQGVLPAIQTNPLEDKPDINPADKANPFKDIKTNPFD